MNLARIFSSRGWQTQSLPFDYFKLAFAFDTPGIMASEGGIVLGTVAAGDGIQGNYDSSYSGVVGSSVTEAFSTDCKGALFAEGDDPTDVAAWLGAFQLGAAADHPVGTKAAAVRGYFGYLDEGYSYGVIKILEDATLRIAIAAGDGTDPTLTSGSIQIALPVNRGIYVIP